jgi:hypothetical protein
MQGVELEHEQRETINWDDLIPHCDWKDYPGCAGEAKWILESQCCRNEKTKFCCDPHSERTFYCTHCGRRGISVVKLPL